MKLDLPIIFCLFLLSLTGCSGYHFVRKSNPFRVYDIESIAVPYFLNKSSLSGISGPMTREITSLLESYPDLRVYSGERRKVDGVLVGIIESRKRRREVTPNSSHQFTSGELKDSIGERRGFYITQRVQVNARLRLVLIRNPTPEDIEIITSDAGRFIKGHPKVIFDETISVQTDINHVISENLSLDSGGVVNFTKNRKSMEVGMQQLAIQARNNLKQEILDAF